MPKIVNDLHRSAEIIKSIGESVLPDGQTVSQLLTIDGIPYWDVFASELARSYLPSAMAKVSFIDLIFQLTKPFLVRVNYFFRDLSRIYKYRNKSDSSPSKEIILCLDFMPQQSRDVIQPVVKYLANNQDKQIISLRDRKWPLEERKLNAKELRRTTWSFWNNDLIHKIKNVNKQLKIIKKYLLKSGHLDKIIERSEPSLKKRIKRGLNRLLTGEFPSLIRSGVLSKYILKNQLPSLVFAGDTNDPRTRIYMLQCKELGIPCLALQFGSINYASIEWRFFPADLVAVWGKDSMNTLISHGISQNKIIMTGSPRNDYFFNMPNSQSISLRKKLNIPEDAPVILLASTFILPSYDNLNDDSEILEAMKRAVFNSADCFENVYLIVKPHPGENEDETKSFSSNNPKIKFIPRAEDIRPFIKLCDAFVSFGSTAAMDAIILDKLVICPAFSGWNWNNAYISSKAVHSPITAKEIKHIFEAISKFNHSYLINKISKQREKLLKNWTYRNDGLAAQRIGNLALDIIQNKDQFMKPKAS